MTGRNVVLAGETDASQALVSALREHDLEAQFHPEERIADALVGIEQSLEGQRPAGAVAVGTGEAALALAITAGKLGVPLAASLGEAQTEEDADRRRILVTLASLEVGPDPARAGNLIAAWLDENPSASDLD